MRVKLTIRELYNHATIVKTTINKGIHAIYEGMRVKLNKTFLES